MCEAAVRKLAALKGHAKPLSSLRCLSVRTRVLARLLKEHFVQSQNTVVKPKSKRLGPNLDRNPLRLGQLPLHLCEQVP